MGNWLREQEFCGEGGRWWSSSVLASKSSRASCPVLLWCLRAEFGLAGVSALDGLFIFSGAGRCAMRFLSHSIRLQESDRKEVWTPVLLHGPLKCFAFTSRLKQQSFSKSANTHRFSLYFCPEMHDADVFFLFFSNNHQTRGFSVILFLHFIPVMESLKFSLVFLSFFPPMFVLFPSVPFFYSSIISCISAQFGLFLHQHQLHEFLWLFFFFFLCL